MTTFTKDEIRVALANLLAPLTEDFDLASETYELFHEVEDLLYRQQDEIERLKALAHELNDDLLSWQKTFIYTNSKQAVENIRTAKKMHAEAKAKIDGVDKEER